MLISGPGSIVRITSTSLGLPTGTADNFNPYLAVGYDNAATTAGSLTISNGGKLLMTGNAVSIPRAARDSARYRWPRP